VTGLIDAVSYLRMGHVFVANMTGNVVCLGFALQTNAGLSIPASAVGIGGFLVGAVAGWRLGHHLDGPGAGCASCSPSRPGFSRRSRCSAEPVC
jgi:uncharacterized membrane protein YoaK (UPF0700 family)